ncbi:MAG TPA: CoA transferase, partial [Ramlibacter sp.]|nr:CoA transferase [Ramlibacter sp.]
PVLKLDEALAHPQFMARGMVLPGADGAHQLGLPVKLSGHAPPPPRRAPAAGEHTAEVLREAGYTPAEVEALRALGAIA